MHTITAVNRSKVKHKKYLGFSLLFNPYYWIFVKPFNGVRGQEEKGYSGENVRYIRQLCCVSLLCLSGAAVAANVRLQVEGLSGQLEKNVRAQLSTIESDEVTPDRRFRARVDDAIREGLKALGYYQPTIEFDLRPPPKKGRQVLIAKVTPGVPVLIGGTDVVLRGGARTDKDYLKLLDTRPAIGTVLNRAIMKISKSPNQHCVA